MEIAAGEYGTEIETIAAVAQKKYIKDKELEEKTNRKKYYLNFSINIQNNTLMQTFFNHSFVSLDEHNCSYGGNQTI